MRRQLRQAAIRGREPQAALLIAQGIEDLLPGQAARQCHVFRIDIHTPIAFQAVEPLTRRNPGGTGIVANEAIDDLVAQRRISDDAGMQLRVNAHEAAPRARHDLLAGIDHHGRVERAAAGHGGKIDMADVSVSRTHIDAGVAADPQIADVVAVQGQYVVRAKTARIAGVVAKVCEAAQIRREPIQATGIAADPDHPAAILADRPDIVAREAGRYLAVVTEMPEAAATRIEQVQSRILAAAPDAVVTIDEQGGDVVARQRCRIGSIMPVDAEADAVVAGQTVGRADPQEPSRSCASFHTVLEGKPSATP